MDTEHLQLAIGLIRRLENDQRQQWLAVWDEKRSWFDFVRGVRLESESPRETILREVTWELGLNRNDLLVSNMAQINMEFVDRLPGDAVERSLAVSFYNVQLYRKLAREAIARKQNVKWLEAKDLYTGQTECGLRICPLLCKMIAQSEVIQRWDSQT